MLPGEITRGNKPETASTVRVLPVPPGYRPPISARPSLGGADLHSASRADRVGARVCV
jgi:hypothetical protein